MTLSGGCCEDAALSCGCQAGVAGGSSSDAVCSPGPAAAVVTAHLAELDPTEMKHVTCSHVLSDRLAYAAVTNIPSALNTTAYSSLVSAAGTGDRVSLTWHLPAAAAPGAPLAAGAGEGGWARRAKSLGMTRLVSAPVHGSGHAAARHSKGAGGAAPLSPTSLFSSLTRYFDEPMELRSSPFSSWDDSSDFYWKKKSIKETDTVLKATGYSDRYGD